MVVNTRTRSLKDRVLSFFLALVFTLSCVVVAVPSFSLKAKAAEPGKDSGTIEYDIGIFDYDVNLVETGNGSYKMTFNIASEVKQAAQNTVSTVATDGYFVADFTGQYLVELWGGNGAKGDNDFGDGGKGGSGGHVYGYVFLNKGDILYYDLGGAGLQSKAPNSDTAANGGGPHGEQGNKKVGGGGGYSAVYLFPANSSNHGAEYFMDTYDPNHDGTLDLSDVSKEDWEYDRTHNFIMVAGGAGGGGAGRGLGGGIRNFFTGSDPTPDGGNGGNANGTPISVTGGVVFAGQDGVSTTKKDQGHVGKGGSDVPGPDNTTALGWWEGGKPNNWDGTYADGVPGGYGAKGNFRGGGGGAGYCGGSGGIQKSALIPEDIGGGGGGSSYIASTVNNQPVDYSSVSNDIKNRTNPNDATTGGGFVDINYMGEEDQGSSASNWLDKLYFSVMISDYFDVAIESTSGTPGFNETSREAYVTNFALSDGGTSTITLTFTPKEGFKGGNNVPLLYVNDDFWDPVEPMFALVDSTAASSSYYQEKRISDDVAYVNVPLNMTAQGETVEIPAEGASAGVINTSSLYTDNYSEIRDMLYADKSYDFIGSISDYYVKNTDGSVVKSSDASDLDITPGGAKAYTVGVTVEPKYSPAKVGKPVTTTEVTATGYADSAEKVTINGIVYNTSKNISYDAATDTYTLTLTLDSNANNDPLRFTQNIAADGATHKVITSGTENYTIPVDGWYAIQAKGGNGGKGGDAQSRRANNSQSDVGGKGGSGRYIVGWYYFEKGTIISAEIGTNGLAPTPDPKSENKDAVVAEGGSPGTRTVVTAVKPDSTTLNLLVAGAGGGGGGAAATCPDISLVGSRTKHDHGDDGAASTATVNDFTTAKNSTAGSGSQGTTDTRNPLGPWYAYGGAGGSASSSFIANGFNTSASGLPDNAIDDYNNIANPNNNLTNPSVQITLIGQKIEEKDAINESLKNKLRGISIDSYEFTQYFTDITVTEPADYESCISVLPTPQPTGDGNTEYFEASLEGLTWTITFKTIDGFFGGNDIEALKRITLKQTDDNYPDGFKRFDGTDYQSFEDGPVVMNPAVTGLPDSGNVVANSKYDYVNHKLASPIETSVVTDSLRVVYGTTVQFNELFNVTRNDWDDAGLKDDYVNRIFENDFPDGGFVATENKTFTYTFGISPTSTISKGIVDDLAKETYTSLHADVTVYSEVTTDLDHMEYFGPDEVDYGDNLTANLKAEAGYINPQLTSVTSGGVELVAGEDYNYDEEYGELTVYADAIKGEVVITASAEAQPYHIYFLAYDENAQIMPELTNGKYAPYTGNLPQIELEPGTDITGYVPEISDELKDSKPGYQFKWDWGTDDGSAITEMPAYDLWVYGTFYPYMYNLTINYVDEDGNPVADSFVKDNVCYDMSASIESPIVSGMQLKNPADASCDFTIDAAFLAEHGISPVDETTAGSDIVINIVYVEKDHVLTLRYISDETGEYLGSNEYIKFADITGGSYTFNADDHAIAGYKIADIQYYDAGSEEKTDADSPLTINGITVDSDIVIDVYYEYEYYDVTFNANGHDEIVMPSGDEYTNLKYNTKISAPADPANPTGYTFGGWYKEAACTNAWNFNTDTVTADTELFAKWTANEYTVTFRSNTIIEPTVDNPPAGSVTYDAAYGTLPTLTRTGYVFDGWYTAATGGTKVEATTVYAPENPADHELFAHWTALDYRIRFIDGVDGELAVLQGIYLESISIPEVIKNYSRTGYTLNGWTSSNPDVLGNLAADAVSVTIPDIPEALERTITYTSDFTANEYEVTFKYDNGTADTTANVTYDSAYGTAIPADPTKTGYTFDGWYTAATGGTKVTAATVYNSAEPADHPLYAHWTVNDYTVTFVYGNGDDDTTDSVTYGTAYGTAIPADPTRDGYVFNGWFTAATGGNQVTAETVYEPETPADHSLYAQWTANKNVIITVKDVDGDPVEGATVTLSGVTGSVTTAADGTCTFEKVADGNYTATATIAGKNADAAVVKSGNDADVNATINFTDYDVTKPVVAHDYDGKWHNADVTINFTDSAETFGDPVFYASVGGSEFAEVPATGLVVTGADDAVTTKNVQVYAISASGVQSDTVTFDVKIDKTAPVVTATQVDPDVLSNDYKTINITADEDASDITSVKVYKLDANNNEVLVGTVDLTKGEGYSYTGSYLATENGTYIIRATNGAGSTSDETIEVTSIDKAAPTIAVSAKAGTQNYVSGKWTNKDVVITVTDTSVSRGTTAFEYKLNDGEWTAMSNTDDNTAALTITSDCAGAEYRFRARTEAAANNATPQNPNNGFVSAADTVTVNRDTVKPTGEASIGTNHWTGLIEALDPFNIFYKEKVENGVIAPADDQGTVHSGIDKVYYIVRDEVLTQSQLEAYDSGWTEAPKAPSSDVYSFIVDVPQGKRVMYAMITDKAGNVTYISTDGLILDMIEPEINVTTTGLHEGEWTHESTVAINVNSIIDQTVATTDVSGFDPNSVRYSYSDIGGDFYYNDYTVKPADVVVPATDLGTNGSFTIPNEKIYNGNYEITITAADKAGNVVTKTIHIMREDDSCLVVSYPTQQTVTYGDASAVFTVNAKCNSGIDYYLWEKCESTDDPAQAGSWTAVGAGVTSGDDNTLTINNPKVVADNGDYYRVTVTSKSGVSKTSPAVKLVVNQREIVVSPLAQNYLYGTDESEVKTFPVNADTKGVYWKYETEPLNTAPFEDLDKVTFTGEFVREEGVVPETYIISTSNLALADDSTGNNVNGNYHLTIYPTESNFVIDPYNPDVAATLEGEKHNDWYFLESDGDGVRIVAPEGYKISETNTADGTWTDYITVPDGIYNSGYNYYLRNMNSGDNYHAISVMKTTAAFKQDTAVPTGTVTTQRSAWSAFLETISFGWYTNENLNVNVASNDGTGADVSGIATVEYKIANAGMTKAEVNAITDWTPYTQDVTITKADSQKAVIYVKITDNAGNVTFISSDGHTFDLTEPAMTSNGTAVTSGSSENTSGKRTVVATDTVNGDNTFNNIAAVDGNGNPVGAPNVSITGNTAVVSNDYDETYVLTALDEAGNDTVYTIIIKSIPTFVEGLDDGWADPTKPTKDELKAAIAAIDALLAAEGDNLDVYNGGNTTYAGQNEVDILNAKRAELLAELKADEVTDLGLAADAAIAAVKDGKEGDELSADDNALIEAIIAARDEAIAAINNSGTVTADQIEGFIATAQNKFDTYVAEDFVNEHASNNNPADKTDPTVPYDKAGNPIVAEGVDSILSGETEYEGYNSDIQDKINELINKGDATSPDVYPDYLAMLEAAENFVANEKTVAQTLIEEAAAAAIAAIKDGKADDALTPEEEALISDVETTRDAALAAIADAATDTIEEINNIADNALDRFADDVAKDEINDAADKAIAGISEGKAYADLTPAEKTLVDDVNAKRDEAIAALDGADVDTPDERTAIINEAKNVFNTDEATDFVNEYASNNDSTKPYDKIADSGNNVTVDNASQIISGEGEWNEYNGKNPDGTANPDGVVDQAVIDKINELINKDNVDDGDYYDTFADMLADAKDALKDAKNAAKDAINDAADQAIEDIKDGKSDDELTDEEKALIEEIEQAREDALDDIDNAKSADEINDIVDDTTDEFADDAAKDEVNDAADEAIEAIKDGKSDDELTDEEKALIDEINDKRDETINALDDDEVDTDAEREAIVNGAKDVFDDDVAKDEVNDAADEAIDAIKDGKDDSELTDDEKDLIDAINDKRDEAINALDDDEVDTDAEREAIVNGAKDDFDDDVAKDEINDAADEAIAAVKDGKDDSELTDEEKDLIDAINDARDDAIAALDDPAVDTDEERQAIVDTAKDDFDDDAAKDEINDAADEAIEAIKDGKDDSELTPEEQALIDEINDKRDEAIAALDDPAVDTDAEREAIVNGATDVFDDDVAKDEVNDAADEAIAAVKDGKDDSELTDEEKDLIDAINDARDDAIAALDDPAVDTDEERQAIVDAAKDDFDDDAAKDEINDAADEAIEAIRDGKDDSELTDEEKDLIDAINDARDDAIAALDDPAVDTDEERQAIVDAAKDDFDDDAAKDEINDAADEAIEAIKDGKDDSELTPEEQALIDEINDKRDEAIAALDDPSVDTDAEREAIVNGATDVFDDDVAKDEVNDAADEAIEAIKDGKDDSELTPAEQALIDEINDKRDEAIAALDDPDTDTQAEREVIVDAAKDTFADDVAKDEINDAADEAIAAVKDGKEDSELTPAEQALVDAINDKRDEAINALDDPDVDTAPERKNIVDDTKDVFADDVAKDDINDAADKAIAGISEGKDYADLTPEEKALVDEVNDKRDEAIAALDGADVDTDEERAAIVDPAKELFVTDEAKDFVNEYASDNDFSDPYDEDDNPVTADNAAQIISGEDEWKDYKDNNDTDVINKINELINNTTASDDPYETFDDMLADAKATLADAKDEAKDAINDAADQAIEDIKDGKSDDELTDEEKALIEEIEQAREDALDDIDNAKSADEINDIVDDTTDEFADDAAKDEVNDAADEAIEAIKDGKSDDELTDDEKALIDEINDKRDDAIDALDDPDTDSDAERDAIVDGAKDAFDDDKAKDEVNDAADEAIEAIKDGKDDSELTDEEKALIDEINDKRDDAIAALDDPDTDTDAERDAIVNDAKDDFKDKIAEDFVNDYASDNDNTNPYDKDGNPVTADNADQIISGKDEYDSYPQDIKDKINDLINKNNDPVPDTLYEDYDKMVDAAKQAIEDAKQAAKDEIDDYAEKAKEEIDNLDNLTPEQKEEYKKAIDEAAEEAKKNIDDADTAADVKDAISDGKKAIDDIVAEAMGLQDVIDEMIDSGYIRVNIEVKNLIDPNAGNADSIDEIVRILSKEVDLDDVRVFNAGGHVEIVMTIREVPHDALNEAAIKADGNTLVKHIEIIIEKTQVDAAGNVIASKDITKTAEPITFVVPLGDAAKAGRIFYIYADHEGRAVAEKTADEDGVAIVATATFTNSQFSVFSIAYTDEEEKVVDTSDPTPILSTIMLMYSSFGAAVLTGRKRREEEEMY